MAYKKNRAAFWKKHIEAWQGSGLSQTAYCNEQGFHPNLFNKWKQKLCAQPQESETLIELPLLLTSSNDHVIELTYKRDFTIPCHGTTELQSVIRALGEIT